MSDFIQENSDQKRCNHIIRENDTSNSEDCLIIEMHNTKGMSSQAREVAEVTTFEIDSVISKKIVEGSEGYEVFRKFPSKAKFHEVGTCTREFPLLKDCLVFIPSPSCHAAYPLTGFIAISP